MDRRLMTNEPQLPSQLLQVQAKVERARETMDELKPLILAYVAPGAVEVFHEFDSKEREHRFYLRSKEPAPLRMRILAGEVLQQLRSALDHLTWQLALLSTQSPRNTTEFPVFRKSEDYLRDRRKKIGDVPIPAQEIIDSLQPFHDPHPEDNNLWVLHRLANDDKHRLPSVMLGGNGGFAVSEFPPPALDDKQFGIFFSDGARRGRAMSFAGTYGPYEFQRPAARIRFVNADETDFEIPDVYFRHLLCFSGETAAKGRPVWDELWKCGANVQETVMKFSPFFDLGLGK